MPNNVRGSAPEETDILEVMLDKYPTLMNSVKDFFNTCYRLFAQKQKDYGMGNIAMNGNKKLALLGIAIRMNDKIQRLLNILSNDLDPENESLEDTLRDISNYGAIGNAVLKDEWKE